MVGILSGFGLRMIIPDQRLCAICHHLQQHAQ
jgi:hypothetical protein